MTRAELAAWLTRKAEVLEGQAQTARSVGFGGSTAGQVQAAEAERYREAARLLGGESLDHGDFVRWLLQRIEYRERTGPTHRGAVPAEYHGLTEGIRHVYSQVVSGNWRNWPAAGPVPVYVGAQCQCMDVEGSSGPDPFCRHCFGSVVPGGES